jgi:hypothetical protein
VKGLIRSRKRTVALSALASNLLLIEFILIDISPGADFVAQRETHSHSSWERKDQALPGRVERWYERRSVRTSHTGSR